MSNNNNNTEKKKYLNFKNIMYLVLFLAVLFLIYLQLFTRHKIINTDNSLGTDTSIIKTSVKEIAELSTSKYYGEVIASSKLEASGNYKEWVGELYDSLYVLYKNVREDFGVYGFNTEPNNRQITDFIMSNYEFYTTDNRYEILRNIIGKKRIYRFYRFIRKNNKKSFFGKYDSFFTSRKNKDKIVYVGRGWVIAGLDFSDFNEGNYYYDKEKKYVQLTDIYPKILDTIINPWFSPKRRIKGYEILHTDRLKKDDFSLINRTKQKCKNELVNQAVRRDILQKSLNSAKDILPNFFSIILDKQVDSVVFNIPNHYIFKESIVYDGILDHKEIKKVNLRIENNNDFSSEEIKDLLTVLDALEKSKELKRNKDESLNDWNALLVKNLN